MNYKLFKVVAVMENGNDEEPIVFTFDLPGPDEKAVGLTLSKMDSIKKVISVEETDKPKSEIYDG